MDPSGAGLLTAYGREEGEAVLPLRYGAAPSDETQAKRATFAWGLVSTPDWLLLGAGFRSGIVAVKPGPGATSASLVLMQADTRAGLRWGGFRASASLGMVDVDSTPASVAGNLVSREHWLGYSFAHDAVIVRAGRLNVPFGLRTVEHTFWVRQTTRTDINDTQEHGAALAYSSSRLRGELMGILGNFQVRPASRREKGYSAYVELALAPWAGVGASSLVAHAELDPFLHTPNTRQAHGLFARVAPAESVALLAEIDALVDAPRGIASVRRAAGLLQCDFEPKQGVHVLAAAEGKTSGLDTTRSSLGGWLGIDYFFWSHADIRADFVRQAAGYGNARLDVTSFIIQMHLYI